MDANYSPLRVTLRGQFAAALRLAAGADKRTMTAFLEVNLPFLAAYAEALKTLDALSVPNPPPPAEAAPVEAPWVPMYKRPGYVGPGSEAPR